MLASMRGTLTVCVLVAMLTACSVNVEVQSAKETKRPSGLTAPDSSVSSPFSQGRAEVAMLLHSYDRPATNVRAVELQRPIGDLRLTRVRVLNPAVREAIDSDQLEMPLTDLRLPYNDSRPVFLTLESRTCSTGGHATYDLDRVLVRTAGGRQTVSL